MARKPTGKPNGRPRTEINWEQFEYLCGIHCTKDEIAGIFKCDEATISNRVKEKFGETFLDIYKKFSSVGKSSLRRWQYKVAEKGNPAMLIWLGKQSLGQRDKEITDNDLSQDEIKKLKLIASQETEKNM